MTVVFAYANGFVLQGGDMSPPQCVEKVSDVSLRGGEADVAI